MKDIADAIVVFMLFLLFIIILFGPPVFNKYWDNYNTQKDREMFLKSYEIVIECRKSYGVSNSANNICGEIPTFFSEVK